MCAIPDLSCTRYQNLSPAMLTCRVTGQQPARASTGASVEQLLARLLQRVVASAKALCTYALGLQGWQSLYRPASLLLGQAKLVELLQVEPEFRAGAEEVSQPQSRVAGNGTLTVQDSGDAVRRHLEPASQGGGAHVERFQLCREVLAGVNGKNGHSALPQW